jgi:hypothetical protein
MQAITITWDPDTGAEPSNCFDGFVGKVFELEHVVETNGTMQILWGSLVQHPENGEHIIDGWVHDPYTGNLGAKTSVPLKHVRSIRYL